MRMMDVAARAQPHRPCGNAAHGEHASPPSARGTRPISCAALLQKTRTGRRSAPAPLHRRRPAGAAPSREVETLQGAALRHGVPPPIATACAARIDRPHRTATGGPLAAARRAAARPPAAHGAASCATARCSRAARRPARPSTRGAPRRSRSTAACAPPPRGGPRPPRRGGHSRTGRYGGSRRTPTTRSGQSRRGAAEGARAASSGRAALDAQHAIARERRTATAGAVAAVVATTLGDQAHGARLPRRACPTGGGGRAPVAPTGRLACARGDARDPSAAAPARPSDRANLRVAARDRQEWPTSRQRRLPVPWARALAAAPPAPSSGGSGIARADADGVAAAPAGDAAACAVPTVTPTAVMVERATAAEYGG